MKHYNCKPALPVIHAIAAITLMMAVSLPARAVEMEAQLRAGVGVTDNIARTADNEIDETIGTAGFTFDLIENASKLDADIRTTFDYLTYQDDTFDSEWVGAASIMAEYFFVDQMFSWYFLNNWGQQLIDPLESPNPGNRDNINFLTTGPTLTVPIGRRHLAGADARYSSVKYEEQPFDNERASGRLWFGREMSEMSTLSLNGFAESVEYDNGGLSPDFDYIEYYGRWQTNSTRNVLTLDVGYTEIEIDGIDERGDGLLVRLDWNRTVSPYSAVILGASSRYSNNGDIFRYTQSSNPAFGRPADTTQTDNPFRLNTFFATYDLNRERNTLRFNVAFSEEDYEQLSDEDRDVFSTFLFGSHSFTRRFFAEATLRYTRRTFNSDGREDNDITGIIGVGLNIGNSFSVVLEQRYSERDSTSITSEYQENRTNLRFMYTPPWGRGATY